VQFFLPHSVSETGQRHVTDSDVLSHKLAITTAAAAATTTTTINALLLHI